MTTGRTINRECIRTFIGVLAFLAAAGFLSACGGGGGGGATTAAVQIPSRVFPGPGANSGVVMGKGSLIVNAVEFSVADPTIKIDGAPGTEAQVQQGMVVTMRGSFGPLDPQGTATAVEVEPLLIGRVDVGGAVTPKVLGQTVRLTNFTIFGPNNTDSRTLNLGEIVDVHGFFVDNNTTNTIEATFIGRRDDQTDPKRQIRGVVTLITQTGFTIGEQAVTDNSAIVSAGNFVEVEGTGGDGGAAVTANVSGGVRIISNFGAQANDEFEIEGSVVSHDAVNKSFVLRTQSGLATVRYDVAGFFSPTVFQFEEDDSLASRTPAQVLNLNPTGNTQFPNAQVEVEGKVAVVGGVATLQAREVELKRRENVVLEGDVDSVAGSNFTLAPFFGVTFAAPPGQVPSAGQHVEVGGEVQLPGTDLSQVRVTRVTPLAASARRVLQGPVAAAGDGATAATDSITILGIAVDTTGLVEQNELGDDFLNAANIPIDKSAFFPLLRPNVTVVKAKAARNAVTGAEPFTPGSPASFTPSSGVELEEHR